MNDEKNVHSNLTMWSEFKLELLSNYVVGIQIGAAIKLVGNLHGFGDAGLTWHPFEFGPLLAYTHEEFNT